MTEINSTDTKRSSMHNRRSVAKCILKWGVSLTMIVFLIARTDFQPLTTSVANYGFDSFRFSLGFLFCSFSVFLTLVRWKTLLSALGVSADTSEVMRIGLLSYALNLLALGSVGGDVGRAVLISRLYPAKRPEVMLSVALDRIIGLYAMFVLAFVFVAVENLFVSENESVQFVAWLTAAGTFLMPVGLICVQSALRSFRSFRIAESLQTKLSTILAIFTGHSGRRAIVQAMLISLTLRTITAIGIYFLGTSLFANAPGIRLHLLAASVGLLTGCLPLPFNGLGALEGVLEFAFQTFGTTPCPPGYGIALALLYRVFLTVVGVLGAIAFGCLQRSMKTAQLTPTLGFDSVR